MTVRCLVPGLEEVGIAGIDRIVRRYFLTGSPARALVFDPCCSLPPPCLPASLMAPCSSCMQKITIPGAAQPNQTKSNLEMPQEPKGEKGQASR